MANFRKGDTVLIKVQTHKGKVGRVCKHRNGLYWVAVWLGSSSSGVKEQFLFAEADLEKADGDAPTCS